MISLDPLSNIKLAVTLQHNSCSKADILWQHTINLLPLASAINSIYGHTTVVLSKTSAPHPYPLTELTVPLPMEPLNHAFMTWRSISVLSGPVKRLKMILEWNIYSQNIWRRVVDKRYSFYSLVSAEMFTQSPFPSRPVHTETISILQGIFQSSWQHIVHKL